MTWLSIASSLALFVGPALLAGLWLWESARAYTKGYEDGYAAGYSIRRTTNDDQ